MQGSTDSILEVFYEEALELVEAFSENVKNLSENINICASLKEIKRIVHTLKGSARMLKFNNLADFSHELEDFFIQLSAQSVSLNSRDFQLLDQAKEYFIKATSGILTHEDFIPEQEFILQLKRPRERAQASDLKPLRNSSIEPVFFVSDKIRLNLSEIEKFSKLSASANVSRSHLEQQQVLMGYYHDILLEKLKFISEGLKELEDRAIQVLFGLVKQIN